MEIIDGNPLSAKEKRDILKKAMAWPLIVDFQALRDRIAIGEIHLHIKMEVVDDEIKGEEGACQKQHAHGGKEPFHRQNFTSTLALASSSIAR